MGEAFAEGVGAEAEERRPARAAGGVEGEERGPRHPVGAGQQRRERPQDGATKRPKKTTLPPWRANRYCPSRTAPASIRDQRPVAHQQPMPEASPDPVAQVVARRSRRVPRRPRPRRCGGRGWCRRRAPPSTSVVSPGSGSPMLSSATTLATSSGPWAAISGETAPSVHGPCHDHSISRAVADRTAGTTCKLVRDCARLPALTVRGLRKAYKDVVAVDGLDLEVARRRVLRPARPERRRQDHDDRDLRGADRAGLGRRRGARPALGDATPRPAPAARAFSCRRRSSPTSSPCSRR